MRRITIGSSVCSLRFIDSHSAAGVDDVHHGGSGIAANGGAAAAVEVLLTAPRSATFKRESAVSRQSTAKSERGGVRTPPCFAAELSPGLGADPDGERDLGAVGAIPDEPKARPSAPAPIPPINVPAAWESLVPHSPEVVVPPIPEMRLVPPATAMYPSWRYPVPDFRYHPPTADPWTPPSLGLEPLPWTHIPTEPIFEPGIVPPRVWRGYSR